MSNIKPVKIWKLDLDQADDLPASDSFLFPEVGGKRKTYLCGHSLGLQPKSAKASVENELKIWHELAVEGHFKAPSPWVHYLDPLHDMMSGLVGALKSEIVIMNSLTANIHFLLAGFYKPNGMQTKILMDSPAFPSDIYALRSHLKVRGASEGDLIFWQPNAQTGFFEIDDFEQLIRDHQQEISLIFIAGLHYLNGQLFDIAKLTKLAHQYDILIGFDLAHAAGNVILNVHDWQVDFACWCTYKYLNGGPGSLGACFIHKKHHHLSDFFQGWWGNSLENRFDMKPDFTPASGALAWQLSNPPIIALAPLKASLEIYHQYGMQKLRAKSKLLTAYLEAILLELESAKFEIKTPKDPEARGAMLCLHCKDEGKDIFELIEQHSIVVDYRKPNTIRVAPNPLYNSFNDCYLFTQALKITIKA
ncbi:MAG: kynureninase [Saprospiraceae bacterium]|nr:kynureninase [Saprospiraceae bacterium]